MLSFYISGAPGFVFLNPLFLATDDCRSVLAVKGLLRRFAPWTTPADPGDALFMKGKGGKSFFCYLSLTPVPLRFALSLLF